MGTQEKTQTETLSEILRKMFSRQRQVSAAVPCGGNDDVADKSYGGFHNRIRSFVVRHHSPVQPKQRPPPSVFPAGKRCSSFSRRQDYLFHVHVGQATVVLIAAVRLVPACRMLPGPAPQDSGHDAHQVHDASPQEPAVPYH